MTATTICTIAPVFGPARDQGTRPTCLAFALSALNQNATRAPGFLSVEYLYRRAVRGGAKSGGLTLEMGLAAARAGQPEEAFAPYQVTDPGDALAIPKLAPSAKLYHSTLVDWGNALHGIESALHRSVPIGLGIRITPSFLRPVGGVVAFEVGAYPSCAHAVVAVGLGTIDGALHVLVRNSWGECWGARGHCWLPWSYLELHTFCIYGEAPWPR